MCMGTCVNMNLRNIFLYSLCDIKQNEKENAITIFQPSKVAQKDYLFDSLRGI